MENNLLITLKEPVYSPDGKTYKAIFAEQGNFDMDIAFKHGFLLIDGFGFLARENISCMMFCNEIKPQTGVLKL